jgi:hypothetical protein
MMIFRRYHLTPVLVFLILTCTLIGGAVGRQAGVAVGVFMGVLWAVILSAVIGVIILREQRQRGHRR